MSGKRYAVLIANSHFPKEQELLQQLRCPENDVDGLYSILSSPALGEFTETNVLKNLAHNKILTQLNRVLVRARRDDLILIYYSGHGKLNRKGRLHLATIDTVVDTLDTTSIPVGRMRDLIEISPSEKVVLILDCCYSGRVKDAWLKGGIDDQLQQEAECNRGLYILAASTAIQAAQEKEGDQYSFFTKYIIEGIQEGVADNNNLGKISVLDLYSYAYEQMKKEKGNSQLPMNWGLNVQGEQLIIAHTGRVKRAKWRAQTQVVLNELWLQGYLPAKIYINAIEVTELGVSDLSPSQLRYNDLLEQLIQKQIKTVEFIGRYYAIAEWANDEDQKRALLMILSHEGQIALENGDWEAAEASFAQAIRLDPLNAQYHVKRGQVFTAQKRWAEAELEIRQAVGLDPTNAKWRRDLDRVLSEQQKWLETTENLLALLLIEPSNEEDKARLEQVRRKLNLSTLYVQSLSCYSNGDLSKALNYLERIRDIEETYKDVPALIKKVHEEIRKRELQERIDNLKRGAEEAAGREEWAMAVEAWTALLALTPDDEKAASNLRDAQQQLETASTYNRACENYNMHRWFKALEDFRKIQEIAPNYKDTDKLAEKANGECARILEQRQRRKLITNLHTEAQNAMEAGDWRRARRNFQTLLSLDTDNRERIADLVTYAEREIARQDETEKKLAQSSTLLNEAQAAMDKEDWGTAINKLKGVLNIDPAHQSAIEKLAQARQQQELSTLYSSGLKLYEAGRRQEALDYFRQVQDRDSNYKDVATHTANALGEMKRARAATLYTKAEKAMEQENWPDAMETLKSILVFDPNNREAAKAMGKARSLQDSASLYAKGRRFYNSGYLQQALECFQQLSEKCGRYKDIDELMNLIRLSIEQESMAYEEKRLKITALYNEALKAVKDEKLDVAIDKLRTLLSLDALHTRASSLYRDLLMAIEDEKLDSEEAAKLKESKRQQELSLLYSAVKKHLLAHEWDEALRSIQHLQESGADVEDLAAWIDTVKNERMRAEIADYFSKAQAAMDKEDWGTAIGNLESLLALEPQEEARAALNKAVFQKHLAELYSAGRVRFRAGDYGKALTFFNQVREKKSDYKDTNKMIAASEAEERKKSEIESLYEEAYEFACRKNWSSAIQKLEAVLDRAPSYKDAAAALKNARSMRRLTIISGLKRKFVTIFRLNRWPTINPENGRFAFLQTRKFFYSSLFIFIISSAFSVWMLINSNQDQPLGVNYYNQGLAFLGKGDLDPAINEFDKSIQANSSFADAYYNRGIALMEKGQADIAIKDFDQALQINNKHADSYFSRGMASKEVDLAYALINLHDAVDLKIEMAANTVDTSNESRVLETQDALTLSSMASKHFRDGKKVFNDRKKYSDKNERYSQAIAEFIKAIQHWSEAARTYIGYGAESYNKAVYGDAKHYFTAAGECSAKSAEAYNDCGLAKKRMKQFAEAIDDFSMAIKLNPDNLEALSNRGDAYYEMGALGKNEKIRKELNYKAIDDLSLAIISNLPKPIYAYNSRGSAYVANGLWELAISDFLAVLKLDPNLVPYCELVKCYKNIGKAYEASKYAVKCSESANPSRY
jgi:tetratricopeptide (TPR) repeat protein